MDEKVDVARVAPLELPLTLLPTTVAFVFIFVAGTPIPMESFTLDAFPRELGVGDPHLGEFEVVVGELCVLDLRVDLRYLSSAESDPPESDESESKSSIISRDGPPLDEDVDVDVVELELDADAEAGLEVEAELELELEVATVVVFTVSLRFRGDVNRAL